NKEKEKPFWNKCKRVPCTPFEGIKQNKWYSTKNNRNQAQVFQPKPIFSKQKTKQKRQALNTEKLKNKTKTE
ncbi:hypothetical protein VIGAN_08147200, partial [Vigna angularis var. angularis]